MTKGPRGSDTRSNLMKIGQLSAASGVSRSSIHHYLSIGLLGEPIRTGLNLHLYDDGHLARLIEIKELRKVNKLSLKAIKTLLDARDQGTPPVSGKASLRRINSTPEPESGKSTGPNLKKKKILKVATELFCKKGYETVRIRDISDALHMGKATFYEYFQTKEELFVECIDRLSLAVVPREKWEAIDRETDFFRKFEKRARAFLEAFESYWGILKLAQTVSSKKKSELAEKGMKAIRLMTLPLRREIQEAQIAGKVREVDSELASYFLLGLLEWVGFRLTMDEKYTVKDGLAELMAFIQKGLALEPPSGNT